MALFSTITSRYALAKVFTVISFYSDFANVADGSSRTADRFRFGAFSGHNERITVSFEHLVQFPE